MANEVANSGDGSPQAPDQGCCVRPLPLTAAALAKNVHFPC
jgi:hypothetical protein